MSLDEKLNQELRSLEAKLPNTTSLQASIIEKAGNIEQIVAPNRMGFDEQAAVNSSGRPLKHWRNWLLPSTAIAASLLVLTVIQITTNDSIIPTAEYAVSDGFSDSDFDWQALMLNEDEFLFADNSVD